MLCKICQTVKWNDWKNRVIFVNFLQRSMIVEVLPKVEDCFFIDGVAPGHKINIHWNVSFPLDLPMRNISCRTPSGFENSAADSISSGRLTGNIENSDFGRCWTPGARVRAWTSPCTFETPSKTWWRTPLGRQRGKRLDWWRRDSETMKSAFQTG